MTIIRSTAYIGRHGEAPKVDGRSKDELKPGQPQILYTHDGIGIINPLITSMGLKPNQIAHGTSTRQRARHSNLATIAGAFGLPIPETYEQAQTLQLPPGLKEIKDDAGLDYFDLRLNAGLIKEIGYPAYARQWFNNLDATQIGGVEVTPAREFIAKRGEYLKRLVSTLGFNDNPRLIVNTTHSPNVEAMVLAGTNKESLDKIGDLFSSGGTDDGYFLLHTDRYERSGAPVQVIIERPGKRLDFILVSAI